MGFTKIVVAVVAMVLAMLAPAVRAEPQEVLRTAAAGVVEALEQEEAMVTSGDRVSEQELNTTYSNYLQLADDWVMTVSSYYVKDVRNSGSYYVCGTTMKNLIMTLQFSANPLEEDVLIQVSKVVGHSWAAQSTKGWYLSVLDDHEVDADNKYPGYYRVMIQPDASKATTWYFQPAYESVAADLDKISDKYKYMKIRDAPGLPRAKDMGLIIPYWTKRDSTSRYVLVTGSRSSEDVELK